MKIIEFHVAVIIKNIAFCGEIVSVLPWGSSSVGSMDDFLLPV